jgi:3-methyl-2-oxobutanoate hydroxymethyltransferase
MSKVTIPELTGRKKDGRKITMITAYDYPFGRIADESGVDIVLVGDSLAMVVQGQPTTLGVTMEEMLYHTRMVSRGVTRALLVGDMPFLSFQTSVEEAVRNAGRFLQAGASAVKLEGGTNVRDRIEAIAKMDIPVMGHVGLTPQSYHRLGGFKVQGGDPDRAKAIVSEAKAVEAAGAFAVVLEGIPRDLGRRISESLSIPTIGIGAGPHCDGQVLVMHDLLGLFDRKPPTFVRQFANLRDRALEAIRRYKEEVESGKFPSEEESYR